MDDMEKLHALLKITQEENMALKKQNVDQEFVIPPDHNLEKKEFIRSYGDLSRLNAFFIDEKLTHDISYECFLKANNINVQKSRSLYQKFSQRRFSMKQAGKI